MSFRKRTRPGLGFVEPCLPSSAKAPPSGPGWLHEIKHDGFRIIARRDGAGVRLFTRRGHDLAAAPRPRLQPEQLREPGPTTGLPFLAGAQFVALLHQ